jgi:hypothetical protein
MFVQTPFARCEHCTATFWWEEATVLGGWRFGSGPEVDDVTAVRWFASPRVPWTLDEASHIEAAERYATTD